MDYKNNNIKKEITPIDLSITNKEEEHSLPMLNSPSINNFSRVQTKYKTYKENALTGAKEITTGDWTYYIANSKDISNSTHKLFDKAMLTFTQNNYYKDKGENLKTRIQFTVEELMKDRGLTISPNNKKSFVKILKEDLEALYNVSLEGKEKIGRGEENINKTRLLQGYNYKNGKITITLTEELAKHWNSSYIMNYDKKLLATDDRKPSSYIIGRKLLEHYNINKNNENLKGKKRKRASKNKDFISVLSLLEACAGVIPTYEEEKAKGRRYYQRIIEPFENALNSLEDLGVITSWKFKKAKREDLTEEEEINLDYNLFKSLYILFTMPGEEKGEEQEE